MIETSPAFLLRYILVGSLNTAVGYGIYCLMLTAGLNFAGSSLFSLVFGVMLSFFTLGRYVFLSQLRGRFVKFLLVWAFLYIFNVTFIAAIIRFGFDAYLAGLIAAIPTLGASFLAQRFFVFSNKGSLS
jgi:putative flippase GtrA